MVSWELAFSKQALKDAKKVKAGGLKPSITDSSMRCSRKSGLCGCFACGRITSDGQPGCPDTEVPLLCGAAPVNTDMHERAPCAPCLNIGLL